jgi:hypothetical protein
MSRTRRWRVAVGVSATVLVSGLWVALGVACGATRASVARCHGHRPIASIRGRPDPAVRSNSLPDLISRIGGTLAEMERTDFPNRAEATADLVADDASKVSAGR